MSVTDTKSPLQGQLFRADRLSHRPYCTNDLAYGLHIRGQEHALKHSHIQANSPALKWRLVFDIDRPAAVFAAEDSGVATPNWIAENPRNGHVHACYEIETAIVTSAAGRSEPLRFAAAIEHAYMVALGADRGYAGLICKNPTHPSWRTQVQRAWPYDLAEMAEWVDLSQKRSKKEAAESPLGRNVSVFDSLRGWAYKNVRKYGALAEWQFACRMQAAAFNCFTTALPANEVDHIAKSVAKWVWLNFDTAASDKKFKELQAHRGAIGGMVSGKTRAAKADERALEALAMAGHGMTQAAIGLAMNVSQKTISNWLRSVSNEAIIR